VSALRDRAAAALRDAVTIHAAGFADRVIEGALKVQIGFNLFLAVAALFGGMDLTRDLSALLLAQSAVTYGVIWLVRRRVMLLAAPVYLVIALVTYVEAKRYSGLVGFVFALEAVLALIALWYVVVLLRAALRSRNGRRSDG
jgi:hypothetical protein